MSKKLAEYSHEEQCDMPYADLLALRLEAYAEHMSGMTIPTQVDEWARKMEFHAVNLGQYEDWCEKREIMPSDSEKSEWCKTLGVWAQRLPLVTAFMVIRWGEEPDHWPAQFTEADIQRAAQWFDKPKANEGVVQAQRLGV